MCRELSPALVPRMQPQVQRDRRPGYKVWLHDFSWRTPRVLFPVCPQLSHLCSEMGSPTLVWFSNVDWVPSVFWPSALTLKGEKQTRNTEREGLCWREALVLWKHRDIRGGF